ncbi:MAG TPA: DUF1996 domain-containing protein [Gaiellaceae bacterium]|nr:DUF1996 domain-containing protein [Gaiellaceae bacterium]
MRAPLVVTLGAAGLLAVGLAASALAKPPSRDGREAMSRADLRGVNFVETCRFSHRAPDDPIVFPGRPGASHDHTFVGNRTTSAGSTFGSLRAGDTTCQRPADTAAYWMPTLYRGSEPVLPRGATIYYRRATLAPVSTFPNGLRVVAGDAAATSPQSFRVTFWNCGLAGGLRPSSTVPTCPEAPGSFLRLHVRFPSCWDGRSLDSPDHRSHMAYALRGVCPATHPVEVPALEVIFRYPTRGGEGFSLASGGQLSAHADFFNAWNPGQLRKLVEGCLNALVHCGRT